MIGSVVWLAMAAVLFRLLHSWGAAPQWRVALFIPLFMAALCVLQVRAQTCVVHAVAGTRNMDHGSEKIADADERRALQAVARGVALRSAAAAAAVTALVVLVS